jgi:hypothetical protein
VIEKLCSRCNEIKSTAEFALDSRARDGLGSHCRQCRREVNLESRDRYPHQRQQLYEEKKFDTDRYDPIRYSRSICGHVAEYVSRAVERFEKRTGKEAPPHMTALLQLAHSFVEEHPERREYGLAQCVQCGVTYTRKPRNRYHICPSCSRERQRALWRAKNDRRRGKVSS